MGKNQTRIWATAVFLGLSDFEIELIDSWARWDMVSHFPYLGWIAYPFVSPILIFLGMLLILRGREKEHVRELEAVRNPGTRGQGTRGQTERSPYFLSSTPPLYHHATH